MTLLIRALQINLGEPEHGPHEAWLGSKRSLEVRLRVVQTLVQIGALVEPMFEVNVS